MNRHLLARGVSAKRQILLGGLLAVASGVALFWWQHSLWMLLPSALVMLAFGLAIPNVLSQALTRYREQLGTAGALFGLLYYLLIGLVDDRGARAGFGRHAAAVRPVEPVVRRPLAGRRT